MGAAKHAKNATGLARSAACAAGEASDRASYVARCAQQLGEPRETWDCALSPEQMLISMGAAAKLAEMHADNARAYAKAARDAAEAAYLDVEAGSL